MTSKSMVKESEIRDPEASSWYNLDEKLNVRCDSELILIFNLL